MNYGDNDPGLMSANLQYLTDYKLTDMENVMEVRTERIFPINSSTYKHIFRLDTAGFLDKSSLLTFKCKSNNGAKTLRANCFNGVLGAIKRVQLHFGDFEIQNLSECGRWSTLNHLYKVKPDVQNKKLSHYLGNQLQYQVLKSDDEVPSAANTAPTGSIYPDNSRSGINYGNFGTGAGAAINSQEITTDSNNNHLHAIPLGMLLPALEQRDIPLFLFTDYKVFLEVEFEADSSQWVNDITQNNYGANETLAAASGDVGFSGVELVVDYLIFPSKVQEDYKAKTAAEGGLTLDFMNVFNIEKTLNAGADNTNQSQEFRLNVLDQEVHYIQFLKQLPNNAQGQERVLLGQRSDAQSINTLQYNINGVDIFPTPQHSPLQHYNQLSYVLGNDLQVIKPLYCKDVNTEYSMLSPPNSNLLGKYNVLALDLSNGEPSIQGGGRTIGNYPVIIKYVRRPHADVLSNINGTPLIATDEKGSLNINFLVATTRLVNVRSMPGGGMSIVVSNL